MASVDSVGAKSDVPTDRSKDAADAIVYDVEALVRWL